MQKVTLTVLYSCSYNTEVKIFSLFTERLTASRKLVVVHIHSRVFTICIVDKGISVCFINVGIICVDTYIIT